MPAGRSWRAGWSELPRPGRELRLWVPGKAPWRGPCGFATIRLNMSRYLTIFAALWVVLTPILCMSGVLDHHCDCDAERACQHEEECAADPCRAFVAARSSSRSTQLLAHDSFPVPAFAAGPNALPPVRATTHLHRCADERTADACRLPFPRSDMPLLL